MRYCFQPYLMYSRSTFALFSGILIPFIIKVLFTIMVRRVYNDIKYALYSLGMITEYMFYIRTNTLLPMIEI
jgi:hypothetical protein